MASPPRNLPFFSAHAVVLAVAATGILAALLAFFEARQTEEAAARAEFLRRATIHHTMTRETIARVEETLVGMRNMFTLEGNVTRDEFVRAVRRVQERNLDVQAFEWVPVVPAEQRVAVEAAMSKDYGRPFVFTELGGDGRPVAANERPEYYPICYVEPLSGNERALGYDLKTGPTVEFLERARQTRETTASGQVRLVQTNEDERTHVIMIWPVYHSAGGNFAAAPAGPERFLGFVEGVIDHRAMLQRTLASPADSIFDVLFVDATEQNPARRVLHYLPQNPHRSDVVPSEQDFSQGVSKDFPLPVGGRMWRAIYRPRSGWLQEQMTAGPLLRASGILVFTALLAGLVHTLGRRTLVIERVVAERTAELSESRRQLSSLMHALPGMAFRCRYENNATVLLYASEGTLALTGHPAEDFLSGRVHLRNFIHPDDVDRVREETQRGLQERREFEIEYRVRARDGTEKWVLSRSRGVYDAKGKLEVFEGLAIDITAQKKAVNERIAIERKLLEGQKLESLGLLAGGIAHDFNNLLTGILGNAGLVRLTLPPNDTTDPQLRAIESAALRAAELCRQMLAYAGKGRFVVEPSNLSTLVEGMLPLLKISIGRGVQVHLALDHGIPAVMADATQLRQIVMNLVINASDAIGDRAGDVYLTTGVKAVDRAQLAAAVAGSELPPGDYVFLEVRDTGCGMTPETVRKIFDPFFSTKFAGRGLGLAAVLGIVRGHHGALHVESTPGRGSVFRLLLPPVTQEPAAAASTVSATPWARPAKVLIIEDDETVRIVAASALKSYNLDPHLTSNGESGLAAFRENPGAYDLVLLDLIMPGLSGEETLVQLRAIKPDVTVLLMSGYSESDLLTRYADARSKLGFLHKPFTREMLKAKLREILG